ncbi:MAG: hypothetical protein JRJ27_17610 [Deltaproteobacteria bacterium]|nr:hypothetical protein [Deltaproteobacteria bacterium]
MFPFAKILFIFSLTVFCFSEYACQMVGREDNPHAQDKVPREIDIGDIQNSSKNFVNCEVIITGKFLGWKSGTNSPLVTRSDWAVKDDTGIIYVSGKPPGKLDYYRDVGHGIQIHGIVRIARNSIAYIEAITVIIHE